MKTATMLSGWLFGFFFICCIVGAADYLRRNWVPRFSTFWVLGAMVSLAIVFAMTWWTTWKRGRTARAWGVTASLTNLSIPMYMTYVAHRRLTGVGWEMIAISAFSLIAYSWPDSERDSPTPEGDDSTPQ
jgi:hypothetical protein